MRIAYLSVAPFVSSGYGVCTRYVCHALAGKHDVTIFSYYGYEGSEIEFRIEDRDVRIVGGDATIFHPALAERCREFDVCIFHLDSWMLSSYVSSLNGAKIIDWAVIDHEPLQRPYRDFACYPAVKCIVPMSNFAVRQLKRCIDINPKKIAEPIPHGADPKLFYEEKDASLPFIPDDCEFLVCSVVDNLGIRENIPEMLEAFTIFMKECCRDAYMYMHALPTRRGGYNLYEVVSSLEEFYNVDVSSHLILRQSSSYYPTEFLRKIYSAADVLLMTIKGGSFEIPVIEAALCNTPSIVTEFSAMAEIIGEPVCELRDNIVEHERGLAVKPAAFIWMTLTSSRQAVLNAEDVAEALRIYYENESMRRKHASRMRAYVLKNLTWRHIGEKWLKLLDNFDEFMDETYVDIRVEREKK